MIDLYVNMIRQLTGIADKDVPALKTVLAEYALACVYDSEVRSEAEDVFSRGGKK